MSTNHVIGIEVTSDTSDAEAGLSRVAADMRRVTEQTQRTTAQMMSGGSRGMAQLTAGLDRTTSAIKRTGGAFRDQGSQMGQTLADLSRGQMSAETAAFSFADALGSMPFPAAAAAAIGLGAAFVLLRDRESDAEKSAKRAAEAHKELTGVMKDRQKAITDQHAAIGALMAAENRSEDAAKKLASARKELAKVNADSSSTERQRRDALIAVNRAEVESRAAARARIDTAQDAVKTSKAAADGVEKEIAVLRRRKQELEAQLAPGMQMRVGYEQSRKNVAELAQVTDTLTSKEHQAAGAHRQVAKDATAAAAATGNAKGQVAQLRGQMSALAAQELMLASKSAQIMGLGAAAASSAGQVSFLIAMMRNLQSASVAARGAAAAAASGAAGGKGTKSINSTGVDENRGRYFTPTIQEQVSSALTGFGRDDNLQDKQARAAGEAGAAGKSADAIRLAGEQAVLKRRQDENKQRQSVVQSGLRRVRSAIKQQLTARDKNYAALRKLPKTGKMTKAKQALLDKADKIKSALESLYGQEDGLVQEAADLAVEASELGFDAGALAAEVAAVNAVSPTAGDDAAAALARLTPGTGDDVAVQQGIEAKAKAELDAAIASGDQERIAAAANNLADIRDRITSLQQAAGATGGSTSTGNTGASVVVNQFFPAGLAADAPTVNQAAAATALRIALAGG